MQQLPTPCPADRIPDATAVESFYAAYQQAGQQGAVFVAIELQGRKWTVKADTLTAGPQHHVDEGAYVAIRTAVVRLIRAREVRSDSSSGPVYFVLYDVASEERARELAASIHAALYGDLALLARAVPETTGGN